ncbi:DUF4133 domain-containing protein [Mucilaginibacter paludis]|uniref:Conjugative transposon protein TraF n=1 Tax=Mucilaginibacter paludis DSM 18603 TaxID=714943 RepID=H1YDU8_9SPHI|nr:DUF4133 domain-containing protein [Mucilaginibacter paludis]EHQ24288.1 hypothetical protein Mucpa_0085 [Mucilaginibacter paludis DSM 18603]
MANSIYSINKAINKPIEFQGLKAQYIAYLAVGLVGLLLLFSILYICGTPVLICLVLIGSLGTILFMTVNRLSHKYGQYGLLKKAAKKSVPAYVRFHSYQLFTTLNHKTHGTGN